MSFNKSKKITLFESAFGRGSLEQGGSNLHLPCPKCKSAKSKKKLYVEIETGWYHCWVCGLSGKNVNFLFRKFSPSRQGQCRELYPDDSLIKLPAVDLTPPPELPSDTRLVCQATSDPDARDVFRYLQGRGLSKLDMYRWRICVSDKFRFRRKAIFPSFNETGELNYYTARCIDETKFKYMHAKVPKKSIIFNEFDIDWNQPVILVEGVFDAVKCPDNTIVALGSSLAYTSELYKKLKTNAGTVIVAFDEDATVKSHDACKKIHAAGCDVYRLSVSGGDLGSRSKHEVKELFKTIKPWSCVSFLSHKISTIKSGSIL